MLKPVINEETKAEELHPFETCSECGRDIDNAREGFYGHKEIPGLVLCEPCYKAKVTSADWAPDGSQVKVKGKWLVASFT